MKTAQSRTACLAAAALTSNTAAVNLAFPSFSLLLSFAADIGRGTMQRLPGCSLSNLATLGLEGESGFGRGICEGV